MIPRPSTARQLARPDASEEPAREQVRAALEAALLADMKEQGITAEQLLEPLDVDFEAYSRWLETGEGPEPGPSR